MQYISQRDIAEAATYAVAKNALERRALMPSANQLLSDVAVVGLVNLAGPTLDDNLDFLGGLPPIANRAVKFAASEIVVSVLMGKNPMSALTVTNIAAIGAGIYVGDYVDTQVTRLMAHEAASMSTKKMSPAQPLTVEGA